MGGQKTLFDTALETDIVTIEILSVYEGSKYTDTCISEIVFGESMYTSDATSIEGDYVIEAQSDLTCHIETVWAAQQEMLYIRLEGQDETGRNLLAEGYLEESGAADWDYYFWNTDTANLQFIVNVKGDELEIFSSSENLDDTETILAGAFSGMYSKKH